MAENKLQIFTSPGCGHCEEVKEAVASGKIQVKGIDSATPVELVDLSSDAGYPMIDALGLKRVPAAYHDGQQCDIKVDEATKTITVVCPEPPQPEPLAA